MEFTEIVDGIEYQIKYYNGNRSIYFHIHTDMKPYCMIKKCEMVKIVMEDIYSLNQELMYEIFHKMIKLVKNSKVIFDYVTFNSNGYLTEYSHHSSLSLGSR